MIQTRGVTATLPFTTHNLPSNTKDGSAAPVNLGASGDDAVAGATLMGTAGNLTIKAHGCSGPPLGGPGGSATAIGDVNYYEEFVIQSDTLPIGTPVTINVKVAAARSYRVSVTQPFPIFSGDAVVNGFAGIEINSNGNSASFSGNFTAHAANFQPFIPPTLNGIFATSFGPPEKSGNAHAGEFTATLPGTVGGPLFIQVSSAQISANSSAVNPVVTDADGQMSLGWGAEVEGGLADIRSLTDGSVFSPISNASSVNVLAILPPPPGVPEPTTAILLVIGAGLSMVRRVRT